MRRRQVVVGLLVLTAPGLGLAPAAGSAAPESSGTIAVRVKDINPGSADSLEAPSLTNVGGVVYFAADDGEAGVELWRSDGTDQGTTLVKDIWVGPDSSISSPLFSLDGVLFFAADDGDKGAELWKSDGTEQGTTLVKDIRTGAVGSIPRNFANVDGTLFFAAHDDLHGTELWKSEPPYNAESTTLVKDIDPGGGFRSSIPSELTNVGGTLFFAAWSYPWSNELWKSDGTEEGTVLVRDINTIGSAPNCLCIPSSFPHSLTDVNDVLFFVANDGITGTELWKSDGTLLGTKLVRDIKPGRNGSFPFSLVSVEHTLLFAADDGTVTGTELWKSDGTLLGTELVKDINPDGSSFGAPVTVTVGEVDGTLFFPAEGSVTIGKELWKSDGTEEGTVLVKDINPGAWSSAPVGMTNVGGAVLFNAHDQERGRELWESDGTEEGTVLVMDINPGAGSSFGHPVDQINVDGTLFFVADDGTSGRELWKTEEN